RSWSSGEVKKAETINYRTLRAERDGLFCERIFGPTKDWECFCGKYKRVKNKGVICDRCGVEVTLSKVRRERMGHIELEVPTAHIWYVKGAPGRVSSLLNIKVRDLERVLYYESYLVTDPGETPLAFRQLLTEEQYQKARADFGYDFEADMGAQVVSDMLEAIDLEDLVTDLRVDLENSTSKQARRQILKRLTIAESFRKSGNRPEWMVLEVLPVIPPELRPLVPLDGGRFATADLNDLYRSVIHRNNRLRRLKDLSAPEVILRNEKRMLQEAVDALFDNGRRGRAVRGSGNRPLKSLSNTVKGKMGRFRQNLLGKRVDYSGRSVIVVGPELKLHQCGLPKRMALELFRPFVIMRLEQAGIVHTVKSARKMLDQVSPEVWDILEEIIQDHPVMLNRAPTLHRLGIQAFQPVLVEGEAIRIHPLVCNAFNADFDGDQMAVHVPLSVEAQLEARLLMLATHNILSPADGSALATPSKDMVLGCYYMTKPHLSEERKEPAKCPRYRTLDEVKLRYDMGMLKLHDDVLLEKQPEWQVDADQKIIRDKWLYTTVGQVLFNQFLPPQMCYRGSLMNKGRITKIVGECFKKYGEDITVTLLDNLKSYGYRYATQSGLTVGINDLRVPGTKAATIKKATKKVAEVTADYNAGNLSNGERYNLVIDAWTVANETVADDMFREMANDQHGYNPVYMMADSGARGSRDQIRQLAGMRGLMAKPQKKITGSIGEIIESPIISYFRDALDVLEYFISTHGARKGLADTALKTADAGYLTRRLVDVAQDTIITRHDCDTIRGIEIEALKEGDEVIEALPERVVGRVALDDVYHPLTYDVIIHAGELITEEKAKAVGEANNKTIRIRSVLTCESPQGVCSQCYGLNLATGKPVDIGEAVGVVAAQSIGEPGTQLTLRTFHIGGTASRILQQTHAESRYDGRIELHSLDLIVNREGQALSASRNGHIVIYDGDDNEMVKFEVPYGAVVEAKHDQRVKKGDFLFSWDPYTSPILARQPGKVEFIDIIDGVTMTETLDESSERIQRVITQYRNRKLHPQIIVHSADGKEQNDPVPIGAYLVTHNNDKVKAGDVLAKITLESSKSADITGGLPRVVELLEARKPKNPATIARIDGAVSFGKPKKGKRTILITNEVEEDEYLVRFGKHVIVHDGDEIEAGTPLTEGDVKPHD
ncbi:DNA-directed RNA polymerase subunit beta', partial [bacterium]|nr:DNA-directed RNA polymerase subunit beta' [bacterium]